MAAAVAFLVGPLSAYFALLPAMGGFVIFALGGLLSLIATITGIVAIVRHSGEARSAGMRGLLVGVVVFAVFLVIALPGGNFPRINDITTDTENPPQFVAVLNIPANAGRDMSYPGGSFAEQQKAGYPDLQPLRLPEPPPVVYARVDAAARSMPGWVLLRRDPDSRTIEGTDSTRIFHFHDDFVIQVRPDGDGSVVQMRSKSRDGKGDIGANAARIEKFFKRVSGL